MIVYIDASALVKRYVAETDSSSVNVMISQAATVGTSIISRAEVPAAISRAMRMNILSRKMAASAIQVFSDDWNNLIRIQMTELLASRAAALAWDRGLRGYDAVHLAVALFWQEILDKPVTLATFDKELWIGSKQSGLAVWPENLVKS